jgi:WD40 repeat protein
MQQYWDNVKLTDAKMPDPAGVSGGFARGYVSHVAGTFALTSNRGDIAVYAASPKVGCLPVQGRRILHPKEPHGDAPRLSWSADGLSFVTIDHDNTMRIWSAFSASAGALPKLRFEMAQRSLHFEKGPFVDRERNALKMQLVRPTCVEFFPSFTLFGTQPFIVVGLANGDILKVNTDTRASILSFPPPVESEENGVVSFVGNNCSAELFRRHTAPVIYLGFANNSLPMVSVSEDGLMVLWQYNQESVSGFGWFVPTVEQRLLLKEKAWVLVFLRSWLAGLKAN